MRNDISLRIFIALIVLYALLAALSPFLPQNTTGMTVPTAQLPASPLTMAIAGGVITLVLYGVLGLVGFFLARRLGLPEIWDPAVTNRQRFVIPALVGAAIGIAIIIGDWLFASVNGLGRFPHPPFPTSIIASISAGIGEETIFRLFFISFWTWLISKVILRGRWQNAIYWVFSVLSAVAFGLGHLPSLMYLRGWTSMSQVPAVLIGELVLLNGIISIAAAYYFKKYGFLAPIGIHFWADVVWHVVWGAL